MDKNKKQKYSSEFSTNPKIQKIHSDIIPQNYNFNTQYSLKFKNRINSCNSPITRNKYASVHQYNPYWMILNNSNEITNDEEKNSLNSINEVKKVMNNSENKGIKLSKINGQKDINVNINEKSINVNSDIKASQSPLNYSSFDELNSESNAVNKMKSIFSIFYKNNTKENVIQDSNDNKIDGSINTEMNKGNTCLLKRNESILNLSNNYFMQKSIDSYSSSSSSIYSSNFNNNNTTTSTNNNNTDNDYNKVIIINSSSNDKFINNRDCSRINNIKESNSDNSIKSLDGSSLIDTSTTHLSTNTEVSSLTISSETVNSYKNSLNQSNNQEFHYKNKNLCDSNNERSNNINLRFKNLYLSRRISHIIPAKNIECLKNYRRQIRRKSNEFGFYTSSDEYPATLYTFRQIHTRFPKQFRKMSTNMDIQNHKIQKFKDNTSINKRFKDSKSRMEKIHHKKNATSTDYLFTIECLNTITTDKNTIKSVKKSSELVENLKNKNGICSNFNDNNKFYLNDSYNSYPNDIVENNVNQSIANNKINPRYEKDYIDGNLNNNFTFGDRINISNCESPNQVLETLDISSLERQKQELQQHLILQIQQQSRYYQENKIDYSYSCTTISSYKSDDSYSLDKDNYDFPDLTKNYYETVIISPNPMSSFTSLSIKKNNDNSLSITASYSSMANSDLKKLKSLCNNINSTLEQIKVINDIESISNISNYDIENSSRLMESKECHTIQLKKEKPITPLFQNNTFITTPELHNANFKLYDSDDTESITSTSSSTISSESIRDSNYIYYDNAY